MQTQITLSDAKARFSEVIEKASQGDEIVITRMGKPVAVVIQYHPPESKRKLGSMRGKIQIAADFDEWPQDIAVNLGVSEE